MEVDPPESSAPAGEKKSKKVKDTGKKRFEVKKASERCGIPERVRLTMNSLCALLGV